MLNESQRTAQRDYQKSAIHQVSVKLNRYTESETIALLQAAADAAGCTIAAFMKAAAIQAAKQTIDTNTLTVSIPERKHTVKPSEPETFDSWFWKFQSGKPVKYNPAFLSKAFPESEDLIFGYCTFSTLFKRSKDDRLKELCKLQLKNQTIKRKSPEKAFLCAVAVKDSRFVFTRANTIQYKGSEWSVATDSFRIHMIKGRVSDARYLKPEEGRWPDIMRVVPKNCTDSVTVSRKELEKTIVSYRLGDKEDSTIILQTDAGKNIGVDANLLIQAMDLHGLDWIDFGIEKDAILKFETENTLSVVVACRPAQ